jgi:hypothetical protein
MAQTNTGTKIPNERGLGIYLISDFSGIELKDVALADALILDYSDPVGCERFLRQCRGSFIGTLYLMPVFILAIERQIEPVIQSMCDGVISSTQVEAIVSKIEKIKQRQVSLAPIDSSTPEVRILTKTMRYMFTRETKLTPVVDHRSHIGYTYPIISEHYNSGNMQDMFQMLENASENDYFRPRFVDKVHLCSNCYSAHLNFRETCPKCQSADLVTENLIHHFLCAYIGPEHDFISGDYLVCPKCNRMLRHIGVDYDKPSIIYNCQNCTHTFQEPVMDGFCFVCQKHNPIDSLIDISINGFELTPIGEESSQSGLSKDQKEDVELQGFISYTTYAIFLKYETERARTSPKPGAAGSLVVKIPQKVKESMGSSYSRMMAEIADFVKNTTLSTDILSFANNNTFLIISPESDKSRLEALLSQIHDTVAKLLNSSLPGVGIHISYKVEVVDGLANHMDVINNLMAPGRE